MRLPGDAWREEANVRHQVVAQRELSGCDIPRVEVSAVTPQHLTSEPT